ncbi:transglutaminaseTgpA domain-containing protein [Pseudactinotalea sp. Z1748]|uniref:transglutaminase family protein n=1 Tax=Pseudactinotalea sp. Z1748 TaxID=3413027 RepID=UPI003C7B75E5
MSAPAPGARPPEGSPVPASGTAGGGTRRDRAGRGSWWPGTGWFTTERVLAIAVPVLLIAMAMAPLEPVYLSARLFLVAGVALVLGTTIAVLGAMVRWHTLTVLALALPTFFAFGGLVAPGSAIGGVIPTPTTWQLMGRGVVTVWKQVLTIAPPLGSTGALLLLPYLLAFVGSLAAVTIALRARHYSLSLILPGAVLVASILFGTRLSVLPGVIGVAGVLISLTWVAHRAGRLEMNRVLAVSVVLGMAAVAGTGASLVLTPSQPRMVLRDYVEPPPDPHDYTSPLAAFRYFVDDLGEETLLRATGVPAGTPALRLATMDSYDGMVWDVTPGQTPATGSFTRTGDRITVEVPEDPARIQVDVEALGGVWVPNIGMSIDVTFTGPRAGDQTEGFYYNTATHTGLTTAGLREGDSYQLTAHQPEPVQDLEATRLVAESLALPEPRQVPDVVSSLATQFADGYTGDYPRIEAIASTLSTQGFFSHGLVNEVPSRPGHGAGRMLDMLEAEQMVGDHEQYAAAMALMVRALGYPARVVMGFEVDPAGGTVQVRGEDVTAWVEVPFEGHGWLPFYPTPDEDQVPQAEDPDPLDHPQPQVLQPPDPPQEPPDVPPEDRDDAEVQDETTEDEQEQRTWALIAAVAAIPLLLLLSPFLIIAAVKARRRRQRRTVGTPDRRIAGGWTELEDQAIDLGSARADGLTRRETAAALDSRFEGAGTSGLAIAADAGVFGPRLPDEEEAATFWVEVRAARSRLRGSVGRRARFRSHFSPRSLRR